MAKDELDPIVLKLKTPEECETFAKNAIERGRPDLAIDARKRAIELRVDAYGANTIVERECMRAVFAYEQVLFEKHGKKQQARRTRDMIERLGIIAAVERAIGRPVDTLGYETLKDLGLDKFTFEAVVLRHPDKFSEKSVEIAKSKVKVE